MILIQLALRSLAFVFWMMTVSVLGILQLPFRWGDRNLDRDFARVFSWLALKIAKVKVYIRGIENLESQQPCVYVANHQSGLDMAIYGSICPRRTVVTGKKEILYIPFFNLFYVAAGNILLNRQKSSSAIAALKNASERMNRENLSVWMFPEGTRNKEGVGLLPFKKGAFYLALAAQVPIVIVIESSLNQVVNWKSKDFKGGKVKIEVLPGIPTRGLTEADIPALMEKVRKLMLETLDRVNAWDPTGEPYAS